jgi:WXG100 family type VII secretion target
VAGQSGSVDLEGMSHAQQNFQTAFDEVRYAWHIMTGQEQALAAAWSGATATKFLDAMNSWLGDLKTVMDQLDAILRTLSGNTGVYADTDESATTQAQSLGEIVGLAL